MILTQVQQSLESLDPLVVPSLYEHSSLSLSSSLKNETDPPPFESSLPLDQILESSFPPPITSSLSSSPFGEHIPISSQKSKQVKKKSEGGKNAWGEGLQPLDIMLELSH
jgi:hypothetical protein